MSQRNQRNQQNRNQSPQTQQSQASTRGYRGQESNNYGDNNRQGGYRQQSQYGGPSGNRQQQGYQGQGGRPSTSQYGMGQSGRDNGNFGGGNYEDASDARFDPQGDGMRFRSDEGYDYGSEDEQAMYADLARGDYGMSRQRGYGQGDNSYAQSAFDQRRGMQSGEGGGRGQSNRGDWQGQAQHQRWTGDDGPDDWSGHYGAQNDWSRRRPDDRAYRGGQGAAAGRSSYGTYGGGYSGGDQYGDNGDQSNNQRGYGSNYGQGGNYGQGSWEGRSAGQRGPKGWERSDERLKEDVSERLYHSQIDCSNVTVQVSSGKVTLDGSVRDRYMKHSIEDIVDAVPGVKDIENRVRVSRDGNTSNASGTNAAGSSDDTSSSMRSGSSGTTAGTRSRKE